MATKTVINISPKVLTGLLTGLGTAATLGTAVSVTPHTFDFLGQWATAAYLAFTVLVAFSAAWSKREHDNTIDAGTAKTGEAAVITSATPAAAAAAPLVHVPFDQLLTPTNDAAAHAAATSPAV